VILTPRGVAALLCTVLAVVASLTATSAHAETQTESLTVCRDYDVPVTLALLPETLHGRLCVPAGAATVQVLLHGGTYNSSYWDFPYQPDTYSYVRAANARGYATFNVDRVGYGQSSRPLSTLLTADTDAAMIHQVVGMLRAGLIGGTAFPKVMLAAHSVGSGVATMEAATYHDVDGVLLTGFTHHLSVSGAATVFTTGVEPAALDPRFGLGYDAGYLTTIPGQRQNLFYAPGDADPGVVATDEQLKDVVSATELASVLAQAFTLPTSLSIDRPVMIADGSRDGLFCAGLLASDCASASALRAEEAPYFSPAACLQTYVLPGAGHDINLSLHTKDYQQAVLDWADAFVGAGAGTPVPPADAC
jgi:pimeloyl-ACP methyl ester carboxylesterase